MYHIYNLSDYSILYNHYRNSSRLLEEKHVVCLRQLFAHLFSGVTALSGIEVTKADNNKIGKQHKSIEGFTYIMCKFSEFYILHDYFGKKSLMLDKNAGENLKDIFADLFAAPDLVSFVKITPIRPGKLFKMPAFFGSGGATQNDQTMKNVKDEAIKDKVHIGAKGNFSVG